MGYLANRNNSLLALRLHKQQQVTCIHFPENVFRRRALEVFLSISTGCNELLPDGFQEHMAPRQSDGVAGLPQSNNVWHHYWLLEVWRDLIAGMRFVSVASSLS